MNQLKPILNLAKAHLFELICAGVALLTLLGAWWFFSPKSDELSEKAKTRLQVESTVKNLGRTPPNLLQGVAFYKGERETDEKDWPTITITPKLTDLKANANTKMTQEREQMLREAVDGNRINRLDAHGRPLFMGKVIDTDEQRFVARSADRQANANTFNFLDNYYKQAFPALFKRLTGGTDDTWATPPELAKLDAQYQVLLKEQNDALDPKLRTPGVGGIGGAPTIDPKHHEEFIKGKVQEVARRTPIYVESWRTFQMRAMGVAAGAASGVQPTATEVFEGYVDLWLQNDMVEAIAKVNGSSKEVRTSPIKRLLMVSVGSGAVGMFGSTSGGSGPGGGAVYLRPPMQAAAAGAAKPGAASSTSDLSFSMTGRVGNERYHVVPMAISIVAEPGAVNRFVQELYQQNNGYTLINRRDTTVDPYAAVAAGYLYGDKPCVQTDLLVECLLFRDWIDPLAPQGFGFGPGGAPAPGPGGETPGDPSQYPAGPYPMGPMGPGGPGMPGLPGTPPH